MLDSCGGAIGCRDRTGAPAAAFVAGVARLLFLIAPILAMCAMTPTALAQAPQQRHIATQLIAETDRPTPGSTVSLAIRMTPQPGWHGYWRNPGDSGIGPGVRWTLPHGAAAGPLEYPVPDRLVVGGLVSYVHEGSYALLLRLRVPEGIAPGTPLPIRGRFDYLVCTREVCVPESADLALDLTVGSPGTNTSRLAAFDGFRAALPRQLSVEGRFERTEGWFRLLIPLPASIAAEDPYFFPVTDGAIAYAAEQHVSRSGDALIITTRPGGQQPSSVEGVLRLRDGYGLSVNARPGVVPAAGADASWQSAFSAIIAPMVGAVLGGLLLNIMPCVFPILSLKALSLAKAGGDEGAAKREAIAYTAGAVLICLGLGIALLALRAGGVAAGWAFQLQDPRVILSLLLLITAVALNLAGLFELPAITGGGRLAQRGGLSGAFWTGALAAFVATPCTGPFMGAALGAALVLPLVGALAIFAGLGLGLALPFLLLGFVPALRRRLPRPGAWMERFRRLMSVPMFLTAPALAWILGRQTGVDGMSLGLAAAMLLGLALWWVGRRQGRSGFWLPLVPVAFAATAAVAFVPIIAAAPAAAASPGALNSEPFSEARLAALQREGRRVFVYFTADWCITCKVNESGALARPQVAEAFSGNRVAVLVGDWTSGDAGIGRFLERHGRSGVPLYVYYAPGRPVEVLPQLLTPARLVSTVS
jgi:thiol:disulfide interchange protein